MGQRPTSQPPEIRHDLAAPIPAKSGKNLFDVRRAACVVNLETIHRVIAKAA
jgi:hypothetical protein